MEITQAEVAVEQSSYQPADTQVRELTELQLAFVGGGIGEVIVA